MILPASDGYFCATLDGSHDCADAPCARRRPVTAHSSSLIVLDINMANPIQVERYKSGRGGTAKRERRDLTAEKGHVACNRTRRSDADADFVAPTGQMCDRPPPGTPTSRRS